MEPAELGAHIASNCFDRILDGLCSTEPCRRSFGEYAGLVVQYNLHVVKMLGNSIFVYFYLLQMRLQWHSSLYFLGRCMTSLFVPCKSAVYANEEVLEDCETTRSATTTGCC